jgi:L-lactate dehydrogenase complex protein LldE
MKVGLAIPCYIDSFFPEVGIATLELLERLGVDVVYPQGQTCCGQPMANNGCNGAARGTEAHFARLFAGFDAVVMPSASCVNHLRKHMDAVPQTAEVRHVRENIYELVDFLHDVLDVRDFPWAEFPHKVGLHNSCTALRSLHEASISEVDDATPFSKPMDLLAGVRGIAFVEPTRADECCGFGGTFSVNEDAVSGRMGLDKVRDHQRAGADYIVSADTSCLMHQQGCARRAGLPLRFIHIAQILNGARA